ncbi:2-oxoacid:acceptor oxidoreductase family protein [Chloroflexota bacterium]
MWEIRIHGRGGQGVVTAARMLAIAFVLEGKWASAFPLFGTERQGAPVAAFVRVDCKPVLQNTQVYEPDCLIILDPLQARSEATFIGLKNSGTVVLSTTKQVTERQYENVGVIGFIDGIAIALKEIGRPIANTCMLGSFAKTTNWITLDSIMASLKEYFEGSRLQGNINCVRQGFEKTDVVRFVGC